MEYTSNNLIVCGVLKPSIFPKKIWGQDICLTGKKFESAKSQTNVRSNQSPPTFIAIPFPKL